MSTNNDKRVVFNILSYLQSLKTTQSESAADDIETALNLLESSLGVSLSSVDNFKEYSLYPVSVATLLEEGIKSTKVKSYEENLIAVENNPKFQAFYHAVSEKGYYEGTTEDSVEYLQRHAKLIQKFNEKMSAPAEKTEEEKETLAEEKKVLGNTAVSSKNYEIAIQYYTEALDLSSSGPNSHVYYCNRAAAYCYLHEYSDAVADAEASVALNPEYVKAYSRLGLAYFFLSNYEKAVEAYTRADEIEPNNESTKKSLKQAKKKLDEKKGSIATTSSTGGKSSGGTAAGPAGGLPDMASMMSDPNLSGMMNNPFMKDAMSKLGGQEGVANLMKDPQMMAMAQKMMQNPAALQQAMSMLGGAGGGAGGMPDLSAMAGLMGGPSGAGGGGKSGKKGQFKGFEDDA